LETEAQGCEQLDQGCYAAVPDRKSNLRPLGSKSDALPLNHCNSFNWHWRITSVIDRDLDIYLL